MRNSHSSLLGLAAGVLAVLLGLNGWERLQSERLGTRLAALARPGDVAMISSESCTYCARARAWFGANGVPFAECFIETDAACAARFRALMAPGTPVLLVRGETQVGFSPQRVVAALER